jgi:hypothetical protein
LCGPALQEHGVLAQAAQRFEARVGSARELGGTRTGKGQQPDPNPQDEHGEATSGGHDHSCLVVTSS